MESGGEESAEEEDNGFEMSGKQCGAEWGRRGQGISAAKNFYAKSSKNLKCILWAQIFPLSGLEC